MNYQVFGWQRALHRSYESYTTYEAACCQPTSEFKRLRPAGRQHKYLAVADAPSASGADDVVGDLFRAGGAHANADLDLGDKRHAVLAAGVSVEIALLSAVALCLPHYTRGHVQFGDGTQHRLGTERFDDNSRAVSWRSSLAHPANFNAKLSQGTHKGDPQIHSAG